MSHPTRVVARPLDRGVHRLVRGRAVDENAGVISLRKLGCGGSALPPRFAGRQRATLKGRKQRRYYENLRAGRPLPARNHQITS